MPLKKPNQELERSTKKPRLVGDKSSSETIPALENIMTRPASKEDTTMGMLIHQLKPYQAENVISLGLETLVIKLK